MPRVIITVEVDLPPNTLNHTIHDLARKVEDLVSGSQRTIYIAAQAKSSPIGYGNTIHGVPNSARLACNWIKE